MISRREHTPSFLDTEKCENTQLNLLGMSEVELLDEVHSLGTHDPEFLHFTDLLVLH